MQHVRIIRNWTSDAVGIIKLPYISLHILHSCIAFYSFQKECHSLSVLGAEPPLPRPLISDNIQKGNFLIYVKPVAIQTCNAPHVSETSRACNSSMACTLQLISSIDLELKKIVYKKKGWHK